MGAGESKSSLAGSEDPEEGIITVAAPGSSLDHPDPLLQQLQELEHVSCSPQLWHLPAALNCELCSQCNRQLGIARTAALTPTPHCCSRSQSWNTVWARAGGTCRTCSVAEVSGRRRARLVWLITVHSPTAPCLQHLGCPSSALPPESPGCVSQHQLWMPRLWRRSFENTR